MDSALLTMIVTVIYNAIAPFLLEKGKFNRYFPFMERFTPLRNHITSIVVAGLGYAGITYAVDVHAHTFTLTWPDPAQAIKALLVVGLGYLIQKLVYRGAVK